MKMHDRPTEWPDWEAFPNTPMYNAKAVVQLTGVPASTLRAWERRHHILSPQRAANMYRLYSRRDVELIRWLKERTDSGMAVSQAVKLFAHRQEQEQQEGDSALAGHEDSEQHPWKEEFAFRIASTETLQPKPEQFWNSYPMPLNMVQIRDHLIEVFQEMDEQKAYAILSRVLVLNEYTIEQLCIELITPTLWHIGQLWSEGQLTTAVEHFASNFFRALLTYHFHITPAALMGPLVLIGSSPCEVHELGALMLALFLRKREMRVAYLGQGIETGGLLDTIRRLRPAMVCLSLTMPPFLSDLQALAQQIQRLPNPQPMLVLGGQAFAQVSPQSLAQLPGHYFSGDLRIVSDKLCALLRSQKGKM